MQQVNDDLNADSKKTISRLQNLTRIWSRCIELKNRGASKNEQNRQNLLSYRRLREIQIAVIDIVM